MNIVNERLIDLNELRLSEICSLAEQLPRRDFNTCTLDLSGGVTPIAEMRLTTILAHQRVIREKSDE